MTHTQRSRRWALCSVYGTVLMVIGGCAFLKSIGRTAAVAGGAAGGAVVGSAGGPIGTVGGAAAGAGVVYAVQENSELRSGSLQGDGAREQYVKELESLVRAMGGDLQLERRAREKAEEAAGWWRVWGVRLLLIGLLMRNLTNLPPFFTALFARRWLRAAHWFLHMIVWPIRPKE